MTDLSQLERSSLTTLRIIVDLLAGEVVALRREVKRLKAEYTQNPQTTPVQCSDPREGTSEPVAWWLKGSEYDTGCEYEYVSLLKENAEAAAAEGGTVTPLYRSPNLTAAEREAINMARRIMVDEPSMNPAQRAELAIALGGLLERLGGKQ